MRACAPSACAVTDSLKSVSEASKAVGSHGVAFIAGHTAVMGGQGMSRLGIWSVAGRLLGGRTCRVKQTTTATHR
jgi:hypothetical protein